MTLVLVVPVLLVPGLWVNMVMWMLPLALPGSAMMLWITRLVRCGLMFRPTVTLMALLNPVAVPVPISASVLLSDRPDPFLKVVWVVVPCPVTPVTV